MGVGLQKRNLVQINSDVTAPVLYFPFLKGELMDEAGMTGNGQRKSLCSFFKANTKSSTRAALARSLHSQPISSKPSCAAKQPRSLSLISSSRRRACRQSIMSMYMFSAQSLSLLHLWTNQGTVTSGAGLSCKDCWPQPQYKWPKQLPPFLPACVL